MMTTLRKAKQLSPIGTRLKLLAAAGLIVLGSTAPFGLPSAANPSTDRPARGTFLVATQELQDSGFSETVVLLVQHDQFGTMGLIINQPSDVGLDLMLPDVGNLGGFNEKLYIGGPVATYGIILLVKSAAALDDAEHVFGKVYVSGSHELLLQIINHGDAPSRVRLYAGHAGWSPGQLDREITRGSWQIMPANESMIFADEPDKVWRKLAPRQRPMIVRVD